MLLGFDQFSILSIDNGFMGRLPVREANLISVFLTCNLEVFNVLFRKSQLFSDGC